MYCTYCGAQNAEGQNIAGIVGNHWCRLKHKKRPIQIRLVHLNPSYPPPRTIPTTGSQNIKVGPKWASIGAALAVLCFFLPWLMVSYSGLLLGQNKLGFSGWQMGTGNLGTGYQQQGSAQPAIFLILLLGLIGFVCLNGKRSGAIAAMASGVAGMIGMIIYTANLGSQSSSNIFFNVQVSQGVGYFGEWLGFLILVGVGFYAFRQLSSHNSPVTPSIPQASMRPPIVPQPSAPPPVVNTVPPVNQTGSGSNNPNPSAPATPAAESTSKKNTWKEIG